MLIGHKKQRQLLNKAVTVGNLPHGLMLEGRSGLGKKRLIIHLFKTLNCQSDEKPCDQCRQCLAVDKARHPDIILLEPVENKIQIGQIKELIHKTSLRPYMSLFKWIIIDSAHLMNQEASNALLKELEEPKNNTTFFLITEYPKMILDTIKSRIQRIKFFPVSNQEIIVFLKSLGCNDEIAREIALFSFGRPGIAFNFFSEKEKFQSRKKIAKELVKITSFEDPFHLRFEYAKKISENPEELKETLEIWLSYLRELLLEKARNGKVNYSFGKLKSSLELIEKTIYLTSKTNTNPRLAMDLLLMEL